MDRLEKELRTLSRKELIRINEILERLKQGQIEHLEVKALQGHKQIYRVRVGRLRVIYTIHKDGTILLLAVRKRDDRTYSDF